MLGWIITVAVGSLVLVTIDLLKNSNIFTDNYESGTGNGRLSPYEQNETTFSDTEVEITESDEARINKAVEEIRKILGPDPIEKLSAMNAEERVAAANKMHCALCDVFSLDIGFRLKALDNDTLCGFYDFNNKVLHANVKYLMTKDPKDIEEYLDTIIHEFRHAMQHEFIHNEEYNGANEEYRKKMACNIRFYVDSAKNPELYYKQLCERDAREFARIFITKLKGGNKVA